MPTLKDTDAAWLAGFIDGDGCIEVVRRLHKMKSGAKKCYLRAQLQLGQTKRPVMDAVVEIVGVGTVQAYKRESYTKGIFYRITWYTPTLRWLLPQLIPHLRNKSRQAELVLEFCNDCTKMGRGMTEYQVARGAGIHAELAELNLRRAVKSKDSPALHLVKENHG